MKHLIKIENTPHGVLGVRHTGLDQQYCEAGEQVILKWQPDAKWGLQEAHYTDGDGNIVPIDLGNGKGVVSFMMPDKNITINGTFKMFVSQDWTEGTNPSKGKVLTVGNNGEPAPISVDELANQITEGDNDLVDAIDRINPFKGWYTDLTSLQNNHPSPQIGDYAYVKGAESTDPAAIYECTTAGTWTDSGRTADTSNVQTFADGEEVNEVHIVNDLTTGGVDDVLSAEQGKVLNQDIKNTEFVYTLYGNSSIIANVVHIDQLVQYGVKGALGVVFNINNTFVVDNLGVLVLDRVNNEVKVKNQNQVVGTDDILLIASDTGTSFFKLGKLLGDYLVNEEKKIPYSIAQKNKGITNNGEVVNASNFIISTPIFIPAGTNLVVRTAGDTLGALCKYNIDSNTYTPIISYAADGIYGLRNAYTTIQESGYYVISTNNATAYNGKSALYVLNNTPHEYNIKLVPGSVSLSDGSFCYSADGSLFSNFTSEKLLKIPDGARIMQIEGVESGEDYYFMQFDDDFNFISYVKNDFKINDRCRYIRIAIGQSTAYTYSIKNIKIFILGNKPCEFVFNTLPSLANSRWIWHTYEVKNAQYVESTDTPTTSFLGNTSRIYSKCYIVLPENYTPTGKPCKVIINCHGTSQISLSSTQLAYNTAYINFLVKCGYAVIGCFSQASLSWRYAEELDVPSSLCMSAYQGMWDYLTGLYNIDKTGAYVFGYSAGGAETVMLSQLKTIPIRCAASLAGTLDSICNMRILTGSGCNNDVFERFGLTYTTLPGGLSSQGALRPIDSDIKDYLMLHLDNIKPYNAFSLHSTLDYSAFQDRFMDVSARTQELESDTTLNSLVSQAKVNLNTPLKIWHAVDDINVPIQLARWYVKMVMNAGGICFLREFPSGCGAHYAVGYTGDTSLTPMMDYTTPYGETINVPVAYAEMVEWFRKW